MDAASFRYSSTAENNRKAKATTLARFLWDRNISGEELLAFSDAHRRRIARAVEINPPSTIDTWELTADLLAQKAEWLERNPEHPAGYRNELDNREMWCPEPLKVPRTRKAKKPAEPSTDEQPKAA